MLSQDMEAPDEFAARLMASEAELHARSLSPGMGMGGMGRGRGGKTFLQSHGDWECVTFVYAGWFAKTLILLSTAATTSISRAVIRAIAVIHREVRVT
jgi:hypothetical protein